MCIERRESEIVSERLAPVIPAKAGIQFLRKMFLSASAKAFCEADWVPAFAGTTGGGVS
jgi:hypothetical protein